LESRDLHAPELQELLTHWTVYPSFLIGWLVLGAAYVVAVGPLRSRLAGSERLEPSHPVAFFTGWILLFLALQGPLHDLSDTYLFSAHMVQHLIITLLVPPLLLSGLPTWVVRRILRPRPLTAAARLLTRPLPAFALYNAVFTVWHVPALYDLMMRHHDVHILMHLSIIASGLLLWWPVVGPVPELGRLSYGAQVLYLFLLGIPMMGLAALITLADSVLYPWYAAAPRLWGLSPRMDEQLGGLIMWVPGTMILWVGMTVAFFKWSAEKEQENGDRALIRGARPRDVK
jgi:putative membrane protein